MIEDKPDRRFDKIRTYIEAAIHETQCEECRVTWRSWLQRIVGIKAGFSPKLPKRKQP